MLGEMLREINFENFISMNDKERSAVTGGEEVKIPVGVRQLKTEVQS